MKLFGGKSNREAKTEGFYAFFAKKSVRITGITLGIVGLLILSAAIGLKIFVRPPDLPPVPDLPSGVTDDPAGNIVSPSAKPSAAVSHLVTDRKEGCYTVLLCGVDYDGFRTDSIMVGLFDYINHKLEVVSVPRDTAVNVKRSIKKINIAHALGGVDQLKAELETVLGFKPDFYAKVDMKGFVRVVDAAGGVEFNVPEDMKYKKTDDGMVFDLKKGVQLLDGTNALKFVRYRSWSSGDDFTRMKNQQALLKAVAKKILQWKNITKIKDFVDIASETLDSDLKLENMLWFATELGKIDADDMNFHTLPTTSQVGGSWYEYVKEDEAIVLINSTINPYIKPITADNLNILKP
ncbi:hypothetical protein FACS189425_04530 [Clostridia bacterium]|nr:hypothetical protein FACS189425_04530 [Clostridia bacterium]